MADQFVDDKGQPCDANGNVLPRNFGIDEQGFNPPKNKEYDFDGLTIITPKNFKSTVKDLESFKPRTHNEIVLGLTDDKLKLILKNIFKKDYEITKRYEYLIKVSTEKLLYADIILTGKCKDETVELVIEVKKTIDFNDFGNILRQIKQYRFYYKRATKCDKTYFCVLAPIIPNEVKKIFTNENILCIEMGDLI